MVIWNCLPCFFVVNLEFVCRVGNNPCSDAENEICVNVGGAAVCECKQGFFLRNGMCIGKLITYMCHTYHYILV